MNEWILTGLFSLLCCLAFFLVVQPFKLNWRMALGVFSLLGGCGFLGYWQWGAWPVWHNYQLAKEKNFQAKQLLATIKSPGELIERLKARLATDPTSARGWFYLGRLYMNQNQWNNAVSALNKSYQLDSSPPDVAINYVESLLYQHQGKFTSQSRKILNEVLKNNPQQPDALALLATDAYQNKQFNKAKEYWTRLLALVPPHSKEAKALHRALASLKSATSGS